MTFTIEKRSPRGEAVLTHCGQTNGAALQANVFEAIKWAFHDDCPLGICFGTREVEGVRLEDSPEPCPCTL